MAVKRCPWCKTDNPAIYDHCMKCGGPLPTKTKPEGVKTFLIPAVVLIIVVIAVIYLVIPALHLSAATGRNLSTAISSASSSPLPRYGIGEPAQYGDLQVTVTQDKFGSETVNNGRFLTVTVNIRNFNSDTAATIGAGDFVLADAAGNYYSSTGIGSRVSYDATPGSSGFADLVYLVPKDATGFQVLYTFPDKSPGTVTGRHEVAFVL